MPVGVRNCKFKKDLKALVGKPVGEVFFDVGINLLARQVKEDGTFTAVGPTPYQRKWFASITARDGKIVSVE